jgi:hypothetical protein
MKGEDRYNLLLRSHAHPSAGEEALLIPSREEYQGYCRSVGRPFSLTSSDSVYLNVRMIRVTVKKFHTLGIHKNCGVEEGSLEEGRLSRTCVSLKKLVLAFLEAATYNFTNG